MQGHLGNQPDWRNQPFEREFEAQKMGELWYWLVVTGTWLDYFPIYFGNHHPNWRTNIFFRGVGQPPTRYGLDLQWNISWGWDKRDHVTKHQHMPKELWLQIYCKVRPLKLCFLKITPKSSYFPKIATQQTSPPCYVNLTVGISWGFSAWPSRLSQPGVTSCKEIKTAKLLSLCSRQPLGGFFSRNSLVWKPPRMDKKEGDPTW